MPNVLEVEDVRSGYGNQVVLRGISLVLEEGGGLGLLGRNGMGKTTTVRTVTGILPCLEGKVLLDGREVQGQAPHRIARRGMAVVPQGRHVFRSLSVQENLDVVARGAGASRVKKKREVFEIFPELEEIASRNASLLSGGQQQMLAFGRAMMLHPRVLLLDEPTEGLAPVIVERIKRAVQILRQAGVAVLVAEQNLRFLNGVVDQVAVLVKGQQVIQADPKTLAESPEVLDRYLLARRDTAEERQV